jgi:hypothetical protein
LRTRGIRIYDSDQFDPFDLAVHARMVAAEITHAHDGYAQAGLAHARFASG